MITSVCLKFDMEANEANSVRLVRMLMVAALLSLKGDGAALIIREKPA